MSRSRSLSRGRLALAIVVAVLGVAVQTLALSVGPVRADDSVAGTPDATITLRGGLSDRDVSVPSGGIVRFVNRDGDRHRMRSRSGDGFDTGNLEPGESFQVRLPSAGTFTYVDEREDDDTRYHGRIRVAGGGNTTGTTGPTGGGAPASATVSIGDGFFQPSDTRVAVGGTVTFRNDDGDEHTATSAGPGGIDSGTLGSGATYRKTFAEAGTFAFLCAFHSDMRGTIQVVAASGQAAPPAPPAAVAPSPAPVTDPAAPSADPGTGTGTGEQPPTAVAADIADFEFRPPTIEVAAGGTVTWTNAGVAPHTVSATDGSFDSGTLETGGVFEQTFASPGSYAYLCQMHPDMAGTVEVVVATAVAPPAAPPAAEQPPAAASAPPDDAPTDGLQQAAALDTGPGPLAGIAAAVTLVSVAVALFARLLAGTARRPEES